MRHTAGEWLKSIFLVGVFALSLTGCANGVMDQFNSGAKKYDSAYLKQNIIPGKTTKDDVMTLFGAPYTQELNSTSRSNESTWRYEKQQEGVDKYMKLAHKYLPTGSSLQMYDAEGQVSGAQGVSDDVKSVTGTKAAPKDKTGSTLNIYFIDNVVKYYSLY